MGDYLIENYVTVEPGEAFRLFPFGEIVKDGNRHVIDKTMAQRFRIPHFKPPIKLGSHNPETPAGGHITGLEVREDGLYALPEFTARGTQVLQEGSYRYNSPEIIWEDGALEDPATGDMIEGPLIVGVALLHTPHLGEAAALYEVNPIQKERMNMTVENIEVSMPKQLWEKFTALFGAPHQEPPAPETVPAVAVEEYDALRLERDDLTAKIQDMRTEQARAERVGHMDAQLKDTRLAGSEQAPEMLADLSDEQAEWFITQFRALSAQIAESNLTADVGEPGTPEPIGDARAQFDIAVKAKAEADKISYVAAMDAVAKEQPALYEAYVWQNYGKREV